MVCSEPNTTWKQSVYVITRMSWIESSRLAPPTQTVTHDTQITRQQVDYDHGSC